MQLEDYFDFLAPDDIRIKGSRIGIEIVLEEYFKGKTAQELTERFDTLSIEKINATISLYTSDRKKFDAYMADFRAWRDTFEAELKKRAEDGKLREKFAARMEQRLAGHMA